MDTPLSVLLRDNSHANATVRLALKADQLSISASRTPLQVPIAGASPIIFDLGMSRPSITVSGIVDNTGTDPTQTTDNAFYQMELLTIGSQSYYVPYKNYLEDKLLTWSTMGGSDLQLEIGDATTPDYTVGSTTAVTGGGVYRVALSQFQFSQLPALEDRWQYSLQFVSEWRDGINN
tara:strand:- start:3038 stop:3568 length:531 start_codon:yes stop_codon:yes gene_type:complete